VTASGIYMWGAGLAPTPQLVVGMRICVSLIEANPNLYELKGGRAAIARGALIKYIVHRVALSEAHCRSVWSDGR